MRAPAQRPHDANFRGFNGMAACLTRGAASVKKNFICDLEKLPAIFSVMVDMIGASVV